MARPPRVTKMATAACLHPAVHPTAAVLLLEAHRATPSSTSKSQSPWVERPASWEMTPQRKKHPLTKWKRERTTGRSFFNERAEPGLGEDRELVRASP